MLEWLIDLFRRISTPRVVDLNDNSRDDDRKWFDHIAAKDGIDYSGAKEYAEKKYSEACAVHDAIDKKAEWVFGIGLAFASAVALRSSGPYILWSLPAFLAIVTSMVLALWTRLPGERDSTMKIKDAISVFENEKSPALVMAAAQHCATAGLLQIIEWKSRQLTKSALGLIAGAVLFLIPLIIINVAAQNAPSGSPYTHYESVPLESAGHTAAHLELKWESGTDRPSTASGQPAKK